MNLKQNGIHDQSFPMLEGFRGLAAILVVYTHYWAFSDHDMQFFRFAHTGVDLFFVISGFVFGPHLLARKENWLPFLIRRGFRIYPMFAFSLLIYVLWAWQEGKPLRYLWEHLSFSYLQSREMAFYYNPPYWSLPAEVEFYLIVPILGRIFNSSLKRFLICLMIAVGLRAVLGYLADFEAENRAFILLHHLPGILVEFLLGSLVWYVCNRHVTHRRSKSLINRQHLGLFLVILGILIWSVLALHFADVGEQGIRRSWLNGQMGAFAALGFSIILLGALLSRPEITLNRPSRLEDLMILAGSLSYGVYLFHLLALRLAIELAKRMNLDSELSAPAIAVIFTLLLAWLAHRLLEKPLRHFGRQLAQKLETKGNDQ